LGQVLGLALKVHVLSVSLRWKSCSSRCAPCWWIECRPRSWCA